MHFPISEIAWFGYKKPTGLLKQMAEDLSALVERIARGISRRGYFVLMDERADQICGETFEPHNLTHVGAIHMLAACHGWQAVVAGRVINFAAKSPEPLV